MARILGQAYEKRTKRLVRRIVLKSRGGENGQFFFLQGIIYVNVLRALYMQLTLELKETIFGENLKHL